MYDPTSETTVTLGDALRRLADRADDLEQLETDDSASGQSVQYAGSQIELQGRSLAALADEHGHDAAVTYRGLSAGQFGRVEDRVERARQRRDGDPALQGYHRVVYAAAGLVEAPFFDPEAVENPPWSSRAPTQRLDAKIERVADLDIGLVKWLYGRVDDATTPDAGNWRPSADSTSDGRGET